MKRIAGIPNITYSRSTIFLDEAGIASLNSKDSFFILTGVIATNVSLESHLVHYVRMKEKYFGYSNEIHATDLFSSSYGKKRRGKSKLFNFKKYKRKYINELADFLDTVPFVYVTCVVNKNNLIKSAKKVKIDKPYETTLGMMKNIWINNNPQKAHSDFYKETIGNIKHDINNHAILNANNYYPLEITYKKVIEEYINSYTKIFRKNTGSFEICFESSPNKIRILKLTEKFKSETQKNTNKKTDLAKKLSQNLYSISFPNKKAKFLGLEIADLISYGHLLAREKRLTKNKEFSPIWNVIKRKKKLLKDHKNFETFFKLS